MENKQTMRILKDHRDFVEAIKEDCGAEPEFGKYGKLRSILNLADYSSVVRMFKGGVLGSSRKVFQLLRDFGFVIVLVKKEEFDKIIKTLNR